MNNKIYIFIGSKKDFESFLDEKIAADEDITYFMDLIKDYNANLRQQHAYLHGIIDVKNLIVHADDYASVFEHVIQNFISIVTTNHDVDTTFLHNPPRRVIESLQASYAENIEYEYTKYRNIDRDVLKEIWQNISKDIIGQEKAKKTVVSNLFRLCNPYRRNQLLLCFWEILGLERQKQQK